MPGPSLALDVARVRLACEPAQVAALNAVGFDWGSFTRNLSSLLVSGTVPVQTLLLLNVALARSACVPSEVTALDAAKFDWDAFAKSLGSLLISGDVAANTITAPEKK